jgi:predicted phage baseplate assembly protein
MPGGRSRQLALLADRIGAYVPEWSNLSVDDAGVALVKLFGLQLDAVLERVERLPEKALIELLSAAGIELIPAAPAEVMLAFKATAKAPASVIVPPAFRVSSRAADGTKDDVVWETGRGVAVTPATIAEALLDDGQALRPTNVAGGESFRPFGSEPKAGNGLLLGLKVAHDPGPTLSIGLLNRTSSGTPAPVAAGGESIAGLPSPLVRWEAFIDGRFQPLEVVLDQTNGMQNGGVVELRLPRTWSPGRPLAAGEGDALRWLRVRLQHGRFRIAPQLDLIVLNVVAARAVRTVRDEFPAPVGGNGPKRIKLSQRPVLPGSVELFVDEGVVSAGEGSAAGDSDDIARLFAFDEERPSAGAAEDNFRPWREVATLSGQGPAARVFTLDPDSGLITFGDNREGMSPPEGVRNIVARSYRVSTGLAGAVEAEAVKKVLTSLPFLQGVSNPLPANGGRNAETMESVVLRGPLALKARGRAVTSDDVTLLAREAQGADVARAFALSGIDPTRPGVPQPGVIGLFVLPGRRPGDKSTSPPMPSAETLRATAKHIAERTGPLGARVVAAAPRFHLVRIETTVAIDPSADAGETVTAILRGLDGYLDPYTGAESGQGWELGAPLLHARLVRRVLDASAAVRSVQFLNVVVDGIRHDPCADVALAQTGLTWPAGHEVVAVIEEESA